ncbi:unnamed protein product [Protopolystoma xenopodis]|uniref:Uncharacterized protein n=1 Tax=Protopolystoma xenopodis TaxID=117903 RepID=A0A448WYI2_9PLAT|nr:unnamed protein product [Protopolystoma xenopodis]
MAFWLSIYYIVVLAYAFYYIGQSFTFGPLPWSLCNQTWNTICCSPNASAYSCITRTVLLPNRTEVLRRVPIQAENLSSVSDLTQKLMISTNSLEATMSPSVINWNETMEMFPEEANFCQQCSQWEMPVVEFWE